MHWVARHIGHLKGKLKWSQDGGHNQLRDGDRGWRLEWVRISAHDEANGELCVPKVVWGWVWGWDPWS